MSRESMHPHAPPLVQESRVCSTYSIYKSNIILKQIQYAEIN